MSDLVVTRIVRGYNMVPVHWRELDAWQDHMEASVLEEGWIPIHNPVMTGEFFVYEFYRMETWYDDLLVAVNGVRIVDQLSEGDGYDEDDYDEGEW